MAVWRPLKRVYVEYSVNLTELDELITDMKKDSEQYDLAHNHSTLELLHTAHLEAQKQKAVRTIKASAVQDSRMSARWKRNIIGKIISTVTGLATEEEIQADHEHMAELSKHVKKALQNEIDLAALMMKMRQNQTRNADKMAEVLYLTMTNGRYWSRKQWRQEQVEQCIDELYNMANTAYSGRMEGGMAARVIAAAGGKGVGHVVHVGLKVDEKRATHTVYYDTGVETVGTLVHGIDSTLLSSPEAQYRLAPRYDPSFPITMHDVKLIGTGRKEGVGIYHIADGVYKAYKSLSLNCMSSFGQASIKNVWKNTYFQTDSFTSCRGNEGFGFGEGMYETEHKTLNDLPGVHPSRIREKTRQGTLAKRRPEGYGTDKIQKEIQDDIYKAREELEEITADQGELKGGSNTAGIVAACALVVAGTGTLFIVGMFLKIRWKARSSQDQTEEAGVRYGNN